MYMHMGTLYLLTVDTIKTCMSLHWDITKMWGRYLVVNNIGIGTRWNDLLGVAKGCHGNII